VGTHQNIIELNGKIYDVLSGKPVHSEQKKAPIPISPMTKSPNNHSRVVDGFFSKKSRVHTPHVPAQVAHHKPQKAHTLMRQSVTKPKTQPKLDTPTTHVKELGRSGDDRLKRAQAISKSSFISKFGFSNHMSPVKQEVKPLAVKQPPVEQKQHQAHHTTPTPKASIAPKQSPASTSSAQAHFDRALAKAKSHEHAVALSTKKPRRKLSHRLGISQKTLNLGATALTAILLIAFFTYQNIPNISMRLAASKAGFSAKLPSYQPSGFALAGPIEYGPGHITIDFKSNSDDRNFNVSQKLSNWNSEALIDNFLVTNNKTYQTYEDKGRTIFTYDGNNATWVSGGIWYQIEGNASLSTSQLLSIATSM
jgi:hypothetical protein